LLHGIIGFTPNTTWLQLAAFVGYLVPVMFFFFRKPADKTPATPSPSAATAPAFTASAARSPERAHTS